MRETREIRDERRDISVIKQRRDARAKEREKAIFAFIISHIHYSFFITFTNETNLYIGK